MLVKQVTSTKCDGWKENKSTICESKFETLREHVINEVVDMFELGPDEVDKLMSGESHSEYGVGILKHGSEKLGYHLEDYEYTDSYCIYDPLEDLDIIVKNLSEDDRLKLLESLQ